MREDIDTILSLKPSLLVHMSSATSDDMLACADANVPVVVCPRSNSFFGIETPFKAMEDAGLSVAMGSDNGMLAHASVFQELAAAYQISSHFSEKPSKRFLLDAALLGGRKVLYGEVDIGLSEGRGAGFAVFSTPSGEGIRSLFQGDTGLPILTQRG